MNCTDVVGDKRHRKNLKKWLIKFVRDEIELCCCAEGLGECGTPTKSLCDEANED